LKGAPKNQLMGLILTPEVLKMSVILMKILQNSRSSLNFAINVEDYQENSENSFGIKKKL
jgi:hypothetical protein